MSNKLTLLLLTTALAVGHAAPALAQTTNDTTTHADDGDDSGKWGLLGLIGAAGLLGLRRRRDSAREVREASGIAPAHR